MTKKNEDIEPAVVTPDTLGGRLAMMLEKLQLSHHGLEAEARLSRGYVSRIVRGQRIKLSPDIMRRIADALGVSYDWLATGRGEKEGASRVISAGPLAHPLEAAIAYHRGKWGAPAVAAARAIAKTEDIEMEPHEWAEALDTIEAALSKLRIAAKRRGG